MNNDLPAHFKPIQVYKIARPRLHRAAITANPISVKPPYWYLMFDILDPTSAILANNLCCSCVCVYFCICVFGYLRILYLISSYWSSTSKQSNLWSDRLVHAHLRICVLVYMCICVFVYLCICVFAHFIFDILLLVLYFTSKQSNLWSDRLVHAISCPL